MSDAKTNVVRPSTRVFQRLILIPVVTLFSLGLLFIVLGAFSCCFIWYSQGYPVISLWFLYHLSTVFIGVALILAAIAFARGRWRYGCISALVAAMILFVVMP